MNPVSQWRSSWRETTLSIFTPAVGEKAAWWQWRANEMHIWFSVFMLISVLPTVVLAIAGVGRVAWIYFAPTFALSLCFLVARFVFRHRYFHTASETLGVSLNFLNPIEVRSGKYEEWCRSHGIVPLTERKQGNQTHIRSDGWSRNDSEMSGPES